MLRITSIAGFTLIILGLIATIAIRVLAVGENAVFDDSPISDWAQRIDAVLFSPQYRAYVGSAITLLLLGWVAACLYFAKRCDEWERKWVKTFIVGCSIMMCFFFILAIVGFAARFTTGFIQAVAIKTAGFMSTPVIMEGSMFFIGLILLFSYNIYRRKADGDDFVTMEIKDEE